MMQLCRCVCGESGSISLSLAFFSDSSCDSLKRLFSQLSFLEIAKARTGLKSCRRACAASQHVFNSLPSMGLCFPFVLMCSVDVLVFAIYHSPVFSQHPARFRGFQCETP
jgi:hypothetical protein